MNKKLTDISRMMKWLCLTLELSFAAVACEYFCIKSALEGYALFGHSAALHYLVIVLVAGVWLGLNLLAAKRFRSSSRSDIICTLLSLAVFPALALGIFLH
ncbi:hypothetical protein [Ruminococcus sp.]|uniref:hypothetical protein n=1 Tax=Ruminococcus sp. TaxID=41978 RepID=UPI00260054B8|nr:hypothetical protein [Ruminococcus sp.]MBQ8965976.1 hypothetical protein [Ruminococcus sp.]